MKRILRSRAEELGWVFWLIVIGMIVSAVAIAWFAVIRPAQIAIERDAVEQSKSYNDASNIALSNYMVQYESPSATDGQKKAIVNAMCEIALKMKPNNVSPRIRKFLSEHGGCE